MIGLNFSALSLGAPLALWGLLALPVLWGIHMLQLRHRHRKISTLFLLDPLNMESLRGSRLRRCWRSRSLWLQTLAIALLVFMVSAPRWASNQGSLKVAVVVDHSASMSAFASRIPEKLQSALEEWGTLAHATEFALYSSSLTPGQVAVESRLNELWPAL